MIHSFLYCNGRGKGYREIVADLGNRELRYPMPGELLRTVSIIWSHNGATVVGGFSEGKYYFVVRDIIIKRDKNRHDDQGRSISMNLAFAATEESKEELNCFVRGFLHCYTAATIAFAECFEFASNLAGYTIDFDQWQAVINACIANSSKQGVLAKIEYQSKQRIQFLFLKYALTDFRDQTEINDPAGQVFSAEDFRQLADTSVQQFEQGVASLHSTTSSAKSTPTKQAEGVQADIEKAENTADAVEVSSHATQESGVLEQPIAVSNPLPTQLEASKQRLIEQLEEELKQERTKSDGLITQLEQQKKNAEQLKGQIVIAKNQCKQLNAQLFAAQNNQQEEKLRKQNRILKILLACLGVLAALLIAIAFLL